MNFSIFSTPVQDVHPAEIKRRVSESVSPVFSNDQKLDDQVRDIFLQQCRERKGYHSQVEQQKRLREMALKSGVRQPG